MLESFSESEVFEAPFARAEASWVGMPKAPAIVGLTVTVNGTTDAVMVVPLKYMVRIQPPTCGYESRTTTESKVITSDPPSSFAINRAQAKSSGGMSDGKIVKLPLADS